jgi:hypothetical protein
MNHRVFQPHRNVSCLCFLSLLDTHDQTFAKEKESNFKSHVITPYRFTMVLYSQFVMRVLLLLRLLV